VAAQNFRSSDFRNLMILRKPVDTSNRIHGREDNGDIIVAKNANRCARMKVNQNRGS